jgi:hypothetical protein
MEILGTYTIEQYTVQLSGTESSYNEVREVITYFNLQGYEITKERYYGYTNPAYELKTI